jgi:maltooligosyltrehalose trehalohydrolase
MNRAAIQERTIGVNFNEQGRAEILVWAPLAQKVELQVTESKAPLSLTKEAYGYWRLQTGALKQGDRYKFVIDGTAYPDPASLSQPEGVHGHSQAIDSKTFAWKDKEWNNLPLEDYILYELHTGTFTPEGTFAAIEKKLDHLIELGINAIELMPVAQFPGARNWGYDGVFPFAVQHSYGGHEGLKKLVNTCHQKGFAVVLDVVYNHLGPEGNYLGAYGPFFTDKYNTPWGGAINFDDAWCDGERHYFIENALMWFRDFHIDALRLDAVHAIKDFSPNHILREIKQHVNALMQETGRTHYLIAELDLNDNRFINPLNEGGYGMDGQWIDEFHHALRVSATGERTGYYADFDGIEHLAKAYRDAYVFDGQYSEHRKKFFGVKADNNPGRQFVVFSQNHDQVGNRMLGERTSELVSFEMQKLLAGAVLVSPFLPMLFMGEEWGEPNPFQYFVSHTDAELAEAVRKGRKAEFAAFHALGEAPDPMAEATFNNSKLQWHLLGDTKHQTLFRYYKQLIAFRKQHPALHRLNRKQVEANSINGTQALFLHRWHETQHVFCLLNFSKAPCPFNPPFENGPWTCLLNSADEQWNGTTPVPQESNNSQPVTIPAEAILIYTNQS